MKKEKQKTRITDILLLIFSVLFLVGVRSIFGPCGPTEEGTWMTCHWAGQAVSGIAAVLTIQSLLHLLVADTKTKNGLSLAIFPTALLAAITPGILIHLCMMKTMHCHAVMRPAVIVFSVLIAGTALVDLFTGN